MAFSKAPTFDAHTYQQSLWSKALAHPARIHILRHLHTHGPTPFSTLARMLPLHRSTVSQHLRILRSLAIVEVRETYPHTIYTINRKVMTHLAKRTQPLVQVFTSA